MARTSENTRQAVNSEAQRREQLAAKVVGIDHRVNELEERSHQLSLLAESNRTRLDQLDIFREDVFRQIQELRKELNIWISSLKAKDYDTKIANLQTESSSHRSSIIQIEDEIEQLRIMWSQREKPVLVEASPPRDNKALQELILLINEQKTTTDRHELILRALEDADSRIENLETQLLKLLSLNGRVESLEGLRA